MQTQELAEKILKLTGAKSIFLYGSRARDDFCEKSDYEIGVLMESKNYISRSEIKQKLNLEKGISVFPFHYEDFVAGNLDTPFVKSIFLKEIIEAGKTLAGEKIIEKMQPPKIFLLDAIQDLRFNLGYALAATHSYRNGDNKTTALHFTKSCLFATRDYILFKKKEFFISYDDIIKSVADMDLREYSELPVYAYKLRKRKNNIEEQNLFKNISYLNKFIEPQLLDIYRKNGNIVLI